MFLKRLERRKGRKKHTYWALVESYRTGKGSRHRVVAYLGELSKRESRIGRVIDPAWRGTDISSQDVDLSAARASRILDCRTVLPTYQASMCHATSQRHRAKGTRESVRRRTWPEGAGSMTRPTKARTATSVRPGQPRWPTGASERYDCDASPSRMMLKMSCSTGWVLTFPND